MRTYIPSLNGLRALSIFSVILVHINIMKYQNGFRFPLFLDRELGVNVFFVLSGFLITTLLLREEKEEGTVSLKDFYLRRTLRIFPVYYILLLVYFILQLSGVLHFLTASWITSLTYTKYFNWKNDWETAHLWSLSVEEHFYLIWPLVFKYARKYRVRFAWLVILIVPVIRIVYDSYHIDLLNNQTIFQKGDALMWGCIFAIYKDRIGGWLKEVRFVFLLILAVFLVLDHSNRMHLPPAVFRFTVVPFGRTTGTLGDMLVGSLILTSISRENTAWFKFLNQGFMNYLGRLSYSLYIWQQLFFSTHLGVLSSLPLNIFLIFIVANLSYYGIEKPFLKLKSRFHKDPPVKPDRLYAVPAEMPRSA